MGQEVKALAESSGHNIVAELTSKNFSSYLKSKTSQRPDIWIDFSTREFFVK